jgi:hypothetical protein
MRGAGGGATCYGNWYKTGSNVERKDIHSIDILPGDRLRDVSIRKSFELNLSSQTLVLSNTAE